MKINKYFYERVIQQNFGSWEDVSSYECNSQGIPKEYTEVTKADGVTKLLHDTLSLDLKEYKLMGYPTRVIFRKILNKAFANN